MLSLPRCFNRARKKWAHLAPASSRPSAFVWWLEQIGELRRIPSADWYDEYCSMCDLTGEEPCSRRVFYSEADAALRYRTDAEIDVVAALLRLKARGLVGVSNDDLARAMGVSKGEASKRRKEAVGCTRHKRDGKFLRIYLTEPDLGLCDMSTPSTQQSL